MLDTSMMVIILGFIIRVIQIIIDASLYLLIGFLIAGAIRAFLGPQRIRALFGTHSWIGPVRAWAIAMLLPVCSLGVLPILRELKRSRVSPAVILTFALVAPMLNPISLLYGVSYLGPFILGVLVNGTLMVAVGLGATWGYLLPAPSLDEGVPDETQVPPVGLRRVIAAMIYSARESVGPTCFDVACGVLGAGLVASLLSGSDLAASLFARDRMAIPRMIAVAPASYLTPEQAAVMFPEMLKFRQSSGAMFVLLALGAGVTIGHVSWIIRSYGTRAAGLWLLLAGGLCLAAALWVDLLIPPVGSENQDNDHFEILANPLHSIHSLSGIRDSLVHHAGLPNPTRLLTCTVFVGLLVTGLILRKSSRKDLLDAYLHSAEAASIDEQDTRFESRWNRPLSSRAIVSFALITFLIIGFMGAYAYYPSPSSAFRDMQIIKADFYGELSASSINVPIHHLNLWDRQAAKLSTGAVIRLIWPSETSNDATRKLRAGIRLLRLAVEQHRIAEARSLFLQVQESLEKCRVAYGVTNPS